MCVVCAREVFATETERVLVSDIPNRYLLTPRDPHPAQRLTDGILLHPTSWQLSDAVQVCDQCMAALRRRKLPKFSLANGLWVGDVPPQLAELSLAERVLIAKYIPVSYSWKLYPTKPKNPAARIPRLYDGVRGNVSTFPLDQHQIADMMGVTKPAPLSLLSATFLISFVGPSHWRERFIHEDLPNNFIVRRAVVAAALIWLRQHNPLWADIDISPTRLAALPEAGVPQELRDIARYSDDVERLELEHQNYVPNANRPEIPEEDGKLFFERIQILFAYKGCLDFLEFDYNDLMEDSEEAMDIGMAVFSDRGRVGKTNVFF